MAADVPICVRKDGDECVDMRIKCAQVDVKRTLGKGVSSYLAAVVCVHFFDNRQTDTTDKLISKSHTYNTHAHIITDRHH